MSKLYHKNTNKIRNFNFESIPIQQKGKKENNKLNHENLNFRLLGRKKKERKGKKKKKKKGKDLSNKRCD